VDAGFKFPEPFAVKADDGITDLYGTMYKPFDFDPAKKYPIILYVYPGRRTESVTKTFSRATAASRSPMSVHRDRSGEPRRAPTRSKWYHNFGYGNLRDYGVPDRRRRWSSWPSAHAWIDMDRVGMGGTRAAAS